MFVMRSSWFWISVFLLLPPNLWSQSPFLSNFRELSINEPREYTTLPDHFIFPGSIAIADASKDSLSSIYYALQNDTLYWLSTPPVEKYPLHISYRYFQPAFLPDRFSLRQNQTYATEGDLLTNPVFNPYEKPTGLLYNQNLNYSGSFGRGMSFGNNQDLVLNANFNLQLSGKLSNDIEILAAITDENLPLQPEGNTQQLREFDKVFVRLSKDNSQLTAGDFDWTSPSSHFLNYFKKPEGISFANKSILNNGSLTSRSSLALSRSKFGRNIIRPSEGNQGPYRLSGSSGEQLIIVMAGTEKVWLDGKLLTRGTEADYLIDYNLSEIRFTAKNFITKDRRIIVEFEYTDQSYSRLLYGLDADWESEKFDIGFYLLGQQDSKQASQFNNLPENAGEILKNAGDNPLLAISPAISGPIEPNPLQVQYILKDTLDACGIRDTILIYHPGLPNAGYSARFTDLGPGNGNYILDTKELANEPVFYWVAPDPLTCRPQGRFEPAEVLTAPEKHAIMTLKTHFRPSPQTKVSAEIAMSNKDPNRLSALDDSDDQGLATRLDLQHVFSISPDSTGLTLSTSAHFESIQADFRALNPFRLPEFNRSWSLVNNLGEGILEAADEQLSGLDLDLQNPSDWSFNYGWQHFSRRGQFNAIRQTWKLAVATKNWQIHSDGQLLKGENTLQQLRFFTPTLNITRILPRWKASTAGIRLLREKNSRKTTHLLQEASFFFDRFEVFFETDPELPFSLETSFAQRKEYAPEGNNFSFHNLASEYQINGKIQASRSLKLEQRFMLRELRFNESSQNNNERNILGRTNLNLNLKKGFIRSNTTWETGSGQEATREFTYIKVAKGQGTHIWLDSLYNNDGIIQLYEMEPAPFADMGDYIKVAGFSRDFISVHQMVFNQNVQINLERLKPDYPWLKRLNFQSVVLINRRTDQQIWNPFFLALTDTSLIALNASNRHTLFFNRGNPTFDLQLSHNDQLSKHVRQAGAEGRQNREWQLRSNLRIISGLNLEINSSSGKRRQDSELFAGKNFYFRFHSLSPTLNYLIQSRFQLSTAWLIRKDKSLLVENNTSATQNQLSTELSYMQSQQSNITLNLKWIDMNLDGNKNDPVAFALLNGLQPGQNLQWQLRLTKLLNKTIQLNIHYSGRKAGQNKIIHNGSAQVSAIF